MEIKILVPENRESDLDNFIKDCENKGFELLNRGGGHMPNFSGYYATLKGNHWKPENNGWIKIKSENDLPTKNIDCFCLLKKGNIIICNSRQTHFWCSDNKWLYNFYDFTHYQPIIKPEPPTF